MPEPRTAITSCPGRLPGPLPGPEQRLSGLLSAGNPLVRQGIRTEPESSSYLNLQGSINAGTMPGAELYRDGMHCLATITEINPIRHTSTTEIGYLTQR